MSVIFKNNYLSLVFLFLIVFLSRIPFITAGYGVEEDSWGIALAAFHTHLTGTYEPSRLPGHPFQEYIFSFLWGGGPVVFNGLCAFFSAIGAVFFELILKQLRFNHSFLAALAFAFVPVYFISSTYTIDFVWTEALVLIAFYLLLKHKFLLSGAFLGLAIGCRITSGIMILPFMMIIWQTHDLKTNVVRFFQLLLPMLFIAVLLFVPVIQIFGYGFFMYYDQFPYPPLTKVLYKMIIGVFGCIGTITLGVCLVNAVFNKSKQDAGKEFNYSLDKKIILASSVIIILFIISYFRLPQKSGYMIPVLPFLIILFGYYLNRKNFIFLCVGFLLSSFLLGINLTDSYRGATHSTYAFIFNVSKQEIFIDPVSGPVFSDYSKRKQKMAFTEQVICKSAAHPVNAVVIAGWWFNEILVSLVPYINCNKVVYESYMNSEKMEMYRKKKYEIYYLPEQDLYNDLMYKMNLTNSLAKPFIE